MVSQPKISRQCFPSPSPPIFSIYRTGGSFYTICRPVVPNQGAVRRYLACRHLLHFNEGLAYFLFRVPEDTKRLKNTVLVKAFFEEGKVK